MNRSARGNGDLLARIVAAKRDEMAALAPRADALERAALAAGPARGFEAALRSGGAVAVIAEFKRRSPSAGNLGGAEGPARTAEAYEAMGAAAVSVLTDRAFFGGALADLVAARAACDLPVLRKDFVLAPIQVYEARAAGADAILLIVRILEDGPLRELRELAEELGMDALVEVHDGSELGRALASGARLIGVNNRDLATFTTDLGVTHRLAGAVPADRTLVAESGIRTPADVDALGEAGVHAVLVGETLMRSGAAGAAATNLVGRRRVARGAAP